MYGVAPIVTLTFFDEAGTETTEDDPNGVFTWKYIIETPMALESATVETIMFVPITTTATIDIIYPEDDRLSVPRLSSPPLSGTFYVACVNTDGSVYATEDMDVITVSENEFKNVLERDCSFLAGKISVSRLKSTYPNRKMGLEF